MNASAKKNISIAGLIVWVCCLVFYLYEFFLRTFVGTMAKSIIHDLSLNSEQFALMGAAYYITYSLMQLPVSYLTNRFGAKKTVIFASVLCGLSVILFSMVQSFAAGVLARLLMGFGSSFGFVSILIVITNRFPLRYYSTFIGISQFVGTMGPLLAGGPLITALKASGLTWRPLFLRIGFFGIILAVIMLILIRNKTRGASSETIFLERPKSLLHQLRALFTNRQAWLIAFFSALTYESVDFLGAIWGTYYLQSRGLSLTLAGYTISASWLGFAIGCPLLTFISDRMRRRKPVLIFCAILGLVSTLIATYFQLNIQLLYPALFFLIGLSASAQNLGIVTIIENVEISVQSLALGFNNGILILFGAIIPVLSSFLIHLPSKGEATPKTFIGGFSILPVMFAIALVLSIFFIDETFCRRKKGVLIVDRD